MLDNVTDTKAADTKLSENTALAEQARSIFIQSNPEASTCNQLLKDQHISTMAQMEKADGKTLACLYHNSSIGKPPEGDYNGRAILLPGSKVGEALSQIGDQVWGGKLFKPGMQLQNKILGYETFPAEVLRGPSWFDGKESTIVDYKDKSYVAGLVRDEIREVSPGLYLGLGYVRLPFHNHVLATFFGLEKNPNSKK